MSNLKVVTEDDEFNALLKEAGDDLVIIDFFTTWCRPCRNMEPVFESMALHYPKALFLKVDADKCFNTAMNHKVTGVPFFVIYFNKSVVETIQGANPQELELKIRMAEIESRRASTAKEQTNNLSSKLAAQVNPVISTYGKLGSVSSYIDPDNSHCLNDLSPTSFHNFIGGKKLISGRGTGKILLVYSFTQKMMLQSFKIKANPQTGPKVLRFFVNHPKVLDFNVGSALAPSQEVTLSHHDLTGERAIELRSGSFQVVTNVQIFVVSSQSQNSRVEIDSIELFGAPILAVQPLMKADSQIKPTNNNNVKPSSRENSADRNKNMKICDNASCYIPGVACEPKGDDDEDSESWISQSTKSLNRSSSPGGAVGVVRHSLHQSDNRQSHLNDNEDHRRPYSAKTTSESKSKHSDGSRSPRHDRAEDKHQTGGHGSHNSGHHGHKDHHHQERQSRHHH